MITLKELIDHLTKVAEENPDMVNLPVQTSSDDEESLVLPLLGSVSFAKVTNIEGYYKPVMSNLNREECNIVILD